MKNSEKVHYGDMGIWHNIALRKPPIRVKEQTGLLVNSLARRKKSIFYLFLLIFDLNFIRPPKTSNGSFIVKFL